jgi:hypothetical protein
MRFYLTNSLLLLSVLLRAQGSVDSAQKGDTVGANKQYDTAMAIDGQLGNTIAIMGILTNMGATEPDPKKAIPIFLKAQVLIDSVSPSIGVILYRLGVVRKKTLKP